MPLPDRYGKSKENKEKYSNLRHCTTFGKKILYSGVLSLRKKIPQWRFNAILSYPFPWFACQLWKACGKFFHEKQWKNPEKLQESNIVKSSFVLEFWAGNQTFWKHFDMRMIHSIGTSVLVLFCSNGRQQNVYQWLEAKMGKEQKDWVKCFLNKR